MTPAYTLQNMTEFWNASTRPQERNGFGLTIEETERNAQDIERSFTFLADTEAVYREWRRIVVQYGVSGVQVHDARLAASMHAHGISEILTLNGTDFARFTGIHAIDPHHI
jgi:predicted nucleic acid-binding protein